VCDFGLVDNFVNQIASIALRAMEARIFSNFGMEMCGRLEEYPFDKLHICILSLQQLPRVISKQVVQTLLQSAYNTYAPGNREILRDIVVLELLGNSDLMLPIHHGGNMVE
jgi:hypothetical protein